jgi:hypothetical protein
MTTNRPSQPQRGRFLNFLGASVVPAAFALRTASAATTGKKTVRIVEFDASGKFEQPL